MTDQNPEVPEETGVELTPEPVAAQAPEAPLPPAPEAPPAPPAPEPPAFDAGAASPPPPPGYGAPAAAMVPVFPNGKPMLDAEGNQVSDKSRLAAALLCWFVGVFGIHRFYVGKVGTGVAMLLTCGAWASGRSSTW